MSARLAALAAACAAILGALVGGTPARTGPFGLDWPEWPEWGERLELDDLRHALEVHPPVAVERWLYNPRERTTLGLRRLEEGPAAALGAFETAGRVAPGDREVLFNLGTARLLADHGDAVGALERAVAAPDELAGAEGPVSAAPRSRPLDPPSRQRAWYNLGNARLAAGDPALAVAAFEEALRLAPADADAKFNLELALRRVEESNRLRLRPPRETPDGDRPGEEQPSDEPGGTQPDPVPEDDRRGGRDPRDRGGEGSEADTLPQEGAPLGRRPLAGFEEQRDLSASQAAALLDAVEELERRQRRLEAARAAGAAGASEEDW